MYGDNRGCKEETQHPPGFPVRVSACLWTGFGDVGFYDEPEEGYAAAVSALLIVFNWERLWKLGGRIKNYNWKFKKGNITLRAI